MKARLVFAIALVGVLVALPAVALGSNSQNYPDSTGEDPQAPDITSVQVSNDDTGLITFKINISNRPAFTSDMLALIFLDTDQKPTTGAPQTLGADYAIQLEPGAVGLFQWNGSDFTFAQQQSSLTYSYDATGATIRINRSDLGGTTGFNFGTVVISGLVVDAQGNVDDTNAHQDNAPDLGHGFWNYKVIAKVQLTQTAFTVSAAKAGKAFQVSLGANESDTNGPVTSGTVACTAKVGTVALRGTHSLANGIATCVFKLPKTSAGKTVRGKMTLTVQGTTLTKTFVAHVH